MNATNSNPPLPPRAGTQHRSNPDRFFHVMSQGWFVFTREGVRGPFLDRPKAEQHLSQFIRGLKEEQDPSNSWRL